MADPQLDKPIATDHPVVQRLVDETGITAAQARELVSLLGSSNWSSLFREARLIGRASSSGRVD